MKSKHIIDWEFWFDIFFIQLPFYAILFMYTYRKSEFLEYFQSVCIACLYFVLHTTVTKIRKLEKKVEEFEREK